MPDRWYDDYMEAWNERHVAAVTSFMTRDIVYEDVPTHRIFQGVEEIAGYLNSPERQSSDYRFTVVDFFETGDRFVSEWVMAGTHTRVYSTLVGDLARSVPGASRLPVVARAQSNAPTTRNFRVRGCTVGLLIDEKIAAQRDYWNMADLLAQLGLSHDGV